MFFFTVFTAKYLGSEQFGQLSFALSSATLFAVFVDFGLGTLTIREVARNLDQASKYLNGIFSLRIVLGLAYLIFMLTFVFISAKGTQVIFLVVLSSLYMFFYHLMQACNAIFRAYEQMKYEAISKLVFTVSLFFSSLFLIWHKDSLVYFGWIYALSMFLALSFALYYLKKNFTGVSINIDIEFCKYLLRMSWPFALSIIFISIYFYMDTVMLGLMSQDTEVGWYNAGYKIIMFVLIFANIVSNSVFPAISRFFKENMENLRSMVNNFAKFMVAMSLPLGFGGIILARKIIKLFYGNDFLGGVLSFQILICSAVVSYISIVYGSSLQACDKQKEYVKVVGLGAGINIVLNLILIPFFSLNGAAIATLLAELSVFVFMYNRLNKIVPIKFYKYIFRPMVASVVMALSLIFLRDLNVIFLSFIGVLVYVTALLLVKGFTKDEIFFYLNLFKKNHLND